MELSPFWFGLYKLVKFAVYPLTWIILLMAALTTLLWLPSSPRLIRWSRILALTTLTLALILSNPVVATTLVGILESQSPPLDPSVSKQFDAIVVLGGGIVGKGSLRPAHQLTGTSVLRTLCGAGLFQQGYAQKLLFTGGDGSFDGTGPVEAVEMKALATRLGIPENAILLEDQSRNTYENALGTKRLLDHGSLLLVTAASHMPRAAALFRKQGFEVTAAPCTYRARDRPPSGDKGGPFDLLPDLEALRTSSAAIEEVVGTITYWAAGKL